MVSPVYILAKSASLIVNERRAHHRAPRLEAAAILEVSQKIRSSVKAVLSSSRNDYY